MVVSPQPAFNNKARWQSWVEIASDITYMTSITVKDIRLFMKKNIHLKDSEADIINKYVIPYTLELHKEKCIKSIKVMRLK